MNKIKYNYLWFTLMTIFIQYQLIKGKTFSISDYNVYPNDNIDDTYGIQVAINESIAYGFNNEIEFGPGIYTISSTIMISNTTNLTVKGAGIEQTIFISSYKGMIFYAWNCQGITLTSFSIDYDPLPFTAGYVVDVNDKYLDIQVVSPHQTDVDQQIQAILRYDPVQMRPAFGENTYEIYQTPPANVNSTIVKPGILRIPLANPTQFRQGDPVVARYAFTHSAIFGSNVVDMTVQSILLYTSWSMGFVAVTGKRLNVTDFHVLPRNGRWMSTSQDCMHFIDMREHVSVTDSQCQAMGDDGLNVCARFFLVVDVIDPHTIVIKGLKEAGPLNVGLGTTLEFTSEQQPFTVHGNGTVASLLFNTSDLRTIIFTTSVNASVNDWVIVADTPRLTIRNFTVANNRARGVLLETRNIDIRQSNFYRTSGPAVLIQPSMYWYEGPEARNVSLIENLYIENNEGLAQEKGVITIFPYPIQLLPVINDLQMQSSTFYLGNYSQGLLQIHNMNNLFLTKNYIATNNSTPLISICNSRNITAENNCVVNNQTKIDQYYTFDPMYPCSMNLSSLIDLPSSAFNSSFPPPVIISYS